MMAGEKKPNQKVVADPKSKIYFFIPIFVGFMFWLILYTMNTNGGMVSKQIGFMEMITNSYFIIFGLVAIGEVILAWKWTVPVAKASGKHMIAYTWPAMPIVFGFIASFLIGSMTPFYYIGSLGLISLYIVYKEIYSQVR